MAATIDELAGDLRSLRMAVIAIEERVNDLQHMARTLTVDEVADLLNATPRAVMALITSGLLAGVQVSARSWVIPRTAYLAFLDGGRND